MALARTRRGESGLNYWPGFVDALSTLILSIIFILTVFVVVQFYLQQEVAGKDTALSRLNAQIAQLTDLLSMEKSGKVNLEDQLAQLRASLVGAEGHRHRLKSEAESAGAGAAAAQGKVSELSGQLEGEKKISARALAQVECSISRSRVPPPARRTRAGARHHREERQGIAGPHRRSRPAAERGAGATRAGAVALPFRLLRQTTRDLGNRPDVRVVGDGLVMQTELWFDTGKAELRPTATAELDKVASALVELEKQIPGDIAWVLRVDGHTDVRPVTGGVFRSNWGLSAARAIAVVQYLVGKGVSPQHLVAAGFGEFQPIEVGATEDAYKRNRRIEFKLTER